MSAISSQPQLKSAGSSEPITEAPSLIVHVPQARGVILSRLFATENACIGAWTGRFTTCIVAIVATPDKIGMVHLDQTSTLSSFMEFVGKIVEHSVSDASVQLVYRSEHLERMIRLTDVHGPAVSQSAHSDLVRWLWELHEKRSMDAEMSSMPFLKSYASKVHFKLIPCDQDVASVSVMFTDVPNSAGVIRAVRFPQALRSIIPVRLVALNLHKQVANGGSADDDPFVCATSDTQVFPSNALLIRHPQESQFLSVIGMEYMLRSHYFAETGYATARTVAPELCIFCDGWFALPNSELQVTGKDNHVALRALFAHLEEVSSQASQPLQKVVRMNLEIFQRTPGVITSQDPMHLDRSAESFVFYYLLWKHGPNYRQWLREVRHTLNGHIYQGDVFESCAQILLQSTEKLTFDQCTFIRKWYKSFPVLCAQLDHIVYLYRPHVDSDRWRCEHTSKLLAKCKEGNAAFAEGIRLREDLQQRATCLQLLLRARSAYEEARSMALTSQLLTSQRVIKIRSNLTQMEKAIGCLVTVPESVPDQFSSTAARFVCANCSQASASIRCEACNGGALYCSLKCQSEHQSRHSVVCTTRQAKPESFTSEDEGLAAFTAFFHAHPQARINLDRILLQPVQGSVVIIQEGKPDTCPMVVSVALAEQVGLCPPDSMQAIRQMVGKCTNNQQTVILMQLNGVFFINCLSLSS